MFDFFRLVSEFIQTLVNGTKAFFSILTESGSFFTQASDVLPSFLIVPFSVGVALLIVMAVINR